MQVTDAAGTTYADHPALAGSPLEEAKLDGGTVVESTTTATGSRRRLSGIGPVAATGLIASRRQVERSAS